MSIKKMLVVAMLSLLLPLPVHAETVYVTDKLYAGLRPQPDKETIPLKTLATGAVLQVLERRGNFTHVRDAEGGEGWVDSSVLATEPPARLQLDGLKKQQDSLKAQLDKTTAALTQEVARSADLARQLAQANSAADVPAAAQDAIQPAATGDTATAVPDVTGGDDWFSPGWMAFSFAMLIIGFFAGVVWLREVNRRKLGGMYLRI